MKTRTGLLSVLVLLAYSAGWAGEVKGTVVDGPGATVPGAHVLLKGNHKKFRAVTNDRGEFDFVDVPAGEYTLAAEVSDGCIKKFKKKIKIAGSSQMELNPVLQTICFRPIE